MSSAFSKRDPANDLGYQRAKTVTKVHPWGTRISAVHKGAAEELDISEAPT